MTHGIDPDAFRRTRRAPRRCMRGKWVLENLLGARAAAAARRHSARSRKTISAPRPRCGSGWSSTRQSGCAACHNSMDPIGFGLENYDAAGRMAHQGRQLRHRQLRHAARRPVVRGRQGSEANSAVAVATLFAQQFHREAADLCARPRARAIGSRRWSSRSAGERRARELPVFDAGDVDRQQPAVSDAVKSAGGSR